MEWRDTGRKPGRLEYTERLDEAWDRDTNLLDTMIERQRPLPKNDDPPLQNNW